MKTDSRNTLKDRRKFEENTQRQIIMIVTIRFLKHKGRNVLIKHTT